MGFRKTVAKFRELKGETPSSEARAAILRRFFSEESPIVVSMYASYGRSSMMIKPRILSTLKRLVAKWMAEEGPASIDEADVVVVRARHVVEYVRHHTSDGGRVGEWASACAFLHSDAEAFDFLLARVSQLEDMHEYIASSLSYVVSECNACGCPVRPLPD